MSRKPNKGAGERAEEASAGESDAGICAFNFCTQKKRKQFFLHKRSKTREQHSHSANLKGVRWKGRCRGSAGGESLEAVQG